MYLILSPKCPSPPLVYDAVQYWHISIRQLMATSLYTRFSAVMLDKYHSILCSSRFVTRRLATEKLARRPWAGRGDCRGLESWIDGLKTDDL